jgi:hypothetical protein
MFGFSFRNLSQSILDPDNRTTTKDSDRIKYYFNAFGSIPVLFIQVRLTFGGATERLNAVAQVIAECDCQVSF